MRSATSLKAGPQFPTRLEISGARPLIGISLYTGAMGLDLGLERGAGVKFVLAADSDPAARTTIHANRPEIRLLDNAYRLTASQVRKAAGLTHDAVIDVVAGCPPCPPWSIAGKRLGVRDARGILLPAYADLAIALQPRLIIHENVKGLASAELFDERGGVIRLIEHTFRRNGYRVVWGIINAADFGAPQKRERLVLIACRDSDPTLPEPTHSRDGHDGLPKWRTLRDALAGLPPRPCDHVNYSPRLMRYMTQLKAGQCWRDLRPDLRAEAVPHSYHAGGGGTGTLRRLAWERPCPTVTCSPSQKMTILGHPDKDRPLSIQECARVQGFADDWRFAGSITDRYRQIGNAVPVPLAEAVGRAVKKTLSEGECSDRAIAERPIEISASFSESLTASPGVPEITFLDLFAGIGAGRHGLEKTCARLGIKAKCAGYSEVDAPAIKTYLRHYPNTTALGDIRTLAASGNVSRCNVVLAGFPCPSHSRAGHRRGFDDDRGQLFFDLVKVIDQARPEMFLLENVDALATNRQGEDLRVVLKTLQDIGYSTHYAVRNSRKFGVAQNRPRIYIVGYRDKRDAFTFPEGTDSTKRLRDVIEAEPVAPRYYLSQEAIDGMRGRKAAHVAKGNGFGFVVRGMDDVAATLVCGGQGRECNLIVDNRIDDFSVLPRRKTPINREFIRNMTPEEWERLQGLPTGWTAGQAACHRYRQLGNAMTAPVIEAIAAGMFADPGGNQGEAHRPARSTHLSKHVSKKGRSVMSLAIEHPGGHCPFASRLCSRLCYAKKGQHPLNLDKYRRNYDLSQSDAFVDTICEELKKEALQRHDEVLACCAHEKGDFYSLDYLKKWRSVFARTTDCRNLKYYIYTRAWINWSFRKEMEAIAREHGNVRINLSTDREMIAKHGVPKAIGNGIVTFLSKNDDDLPSEGIDLVFRNTSRRNQPPLERIGGALVCPNESRLHYAVGDDGNAILEKGNPVRVRCSECRLCIDRSLSEFRTVEQRYRRSAPSLTGTRNASAGAGELTFIDLFSGLGGIRLAMQQAAPGARCVLSSENNGPARETYRINFGEVPQGDIRAIAADDIPHHDILCAGFPCQSLSICGNGKGLADPERSGLFHEIPRFLMAAKPKIALLENVKGLVSHDGGRTLQIVLNELGDAGYDVHWKVLDASQYGAPTARKRIYIVAFRRDIEVRTFAFPEPTRTPVRLMDFLQPDAETDAYVVSRAHSVSFRKTDAHPDAKESCPLRPIVIGNLDGRTGQGYRIYSDLGHAVTICSRAGGLGAKAGLYLVNGRIRRLTPRECARVMGILDEFVLPNSNEQAYRLIGNSVAVPVVKLILESAIRAVYK